MIFGGFYPQEKFLHDLLECRIGSYQMDLMRVRLVPSNSVCPIFFLAPSLRLTLLLPFGCASSFSGTPPPLAPSATRSPQHRLPPPYHTPALPPSSLARARMRILDSVTLSISNTTLEILGNAFLDRSFEENNKRCNLLKTFL
jgi:hypothetical protein